MDHTGSHDLFERAQETIPGGVNSPVRAFASVGTQPVFYESAEGARVTDVDGNQYIDFIGSWGPMILGHRPAVVMDAVSEQLARGTSFGAPCEAEVLLGEKICAIVPAAERVRMVSSGTEATMSALRVARGYTGRERIVKFEGCYHGHSDALLVDAGSGVATLGIPGSPGVTRGAVADTISVPYNDLDALRATFEAEPDTIAAVIIEPIAGNMGVVPPAEGYLEGVRELCTQYGAVLIFDEVISGFRAALGGAQELYGVTPDMCCFGKIIGGGFPVGAFAGKAEIMSRLAPEGPVYQAGTLSGNPVAMVAGLAMIEELERRDPYARLDQLATRLADGLDAAATEAGIPHTINQAGSVLTIFFTETPVHDWDTAATSDTELFARYFRGMLERGFLIGPSQFEALFVSDAHTEADIDAFIQAAREVFAELV